MKKNKEEKKKGSLVSKDTDTYFPSSCSANDAVDIGQVMTAYKAAETPELKESIDLFFIATPCNK